MSNEIKKVLNGEYKNPKLDNYMDDLLYASIITLDLSAYMNMRALRTSVITDDYRYEQEQVEENILGL